MINGSALYAPSPSRLRSLSGRARGPGGAPAARRGRTTWSAGQNVTGQRGLPAGGCEEGAGITEGDRPPVGRYAVVRADRRIGAPVPPCSPESPPPPTTQ